MLIGNTAEALQMSGLKDSGVFLVSINTFDDVKTKFKYKKFILPLILAYVETSKIHSPPRYISEK